MSTENFVQVPPNSTGLKVRTVEVTRADGTVVEEQIVSIGDPNDPNAVAPVSLAKGIKVDNTEVTTLLRLVLNEVRALRYTLAVLSGKTFDPNLLADEHDVG